jgi:HrpA-like RNA helicase|nr:MAG TPA: AAA domain protein [Crassvirales sp.]
MKYAFDKSGSNLYNANNTVIITGDAGSGKTSVVGKSVIDFLGPETKILCVGPTST